MSVGLAMASVETVTDIIRQCGVVSRIYGSEDHPMFAQLRVNLWRGHRFHIKTPLHTDSPMVTNNSRDEGSKRGHPRSTPLPTFYALCPS